MTLEEKLVEDIKDKNYPLYVSEEEWGDDYSYLVETIQEEELLKRLDTLSKSHKAELKRAIDRAIEDRGDLTCSCKQPESCHNCDTVRADLYREFGVEG